MKNNILIIMTVFGINKAIAQSTPTIIVINFNTECPNATPTWSSDDCNYRVEYLDKMDYTLRSIVYDKAGYITRRDWKMDNNYPTRISDYYTAVYPNKPYAVWSSIDDYGRQSYYIIHDLEKIWFDKNGKTKNCTL